MQTSVVGGDDCDVILAMMKALVGVVVGESSEGDVVHVHLALADTGAVTVVASARRLKMETDKLTSVASKALLSPILRKQVRVKKSRVWMFRSRLYQWNISTGPPVHSVNFLPCGCSMT